MCSSVTWGVLSAERTTACYATTSSSTPLTAWCLVVVSLHGRATLEDLRQYDAGFPFSTLAGLGPEQVIARQYQALPIPTTVFIDRDGFIRDVRRGRLDEDDLLRSLQGLL